MTTKEVDVLDSVEQKYAQQKKDNDAQLKEFETTKTVAVSKT